MGIQKSQLVEYRHYFSMSVEIATMLKSTKVDAWGVLLPPITPQPSHAASYYETAVIFPPMLISSISCHSKSKPLAILVKSMTKANKEYSK